MLKLMSMRKKDSKGTIKSNFVTSCLAFRVSIPTKKVKKKKKSTFDSWLYIVVKNTIIGTLVLTTTRCLSLYYTHVLRCKHFHILLLCVSIVGHTTFLNLLIHFVNLFYSN